MVDRLFGTNGVRGIVNEEMTPEFAMELGKAIGRFMGGKVAIATDTRTSGEMIKSAVSAGLMAVGVDVLDLGVAPTPALQYLVKNNTIGGGVMITASHNPPEFNGIKCVDPDGTEMHRSNEERIESIYFSKEAGCSPWDRVGDMRPVSGAVESYVKAVVALVDRLAIKDSGLEVVLDCANGAASASGPMLMNALGVRAVTLNANPQGNFPGHPSEPTEDHLRDLISLVRETGAAMGIAHDGDADRTIFVDEKGNYVFGDKSLAVISRHMVRENGGTVVTPVSTSSCVEDVVKAAGGDVVYTKVGSPIVARKMMEIGAVFGGEENGGLIFPEHQYCRDGAMTAAKMLEVVAKEGDLSSLIATVPEYHLDKRKIVCPNARKEGLLEQVAEHFSDQRVDTTDGVKIIFDDGWTLIRPSGTEPIFRIFSESRSDTSSRRRGEECELLLKEFLAGDQSSA